MSRLQVLIIPDKLKGTLSSAHAAKAIARGWRRARPQDSLRLLPMTDGGDGFGEVLRPLLGGENRSATAVDAAHRPCVVTWARTPKTRTALIESANVVGLAMLPAGRFHPFQLDTLGLGLLLKKIAAGGTPRCIIGLGGSATNDGGFGAARALGWEFRDKAGGLITQWTALDRLTTIHRPGGARLFTQVVAAVDVSNPLLGQRGATRVYGPQKGLRGEELLCAERSLRRLALVAARELGHDFAQDPGAGAAGGLGFGLRAFLNACLVPGFEIFARESKLEQHLAGADLVITAEGTIDQSTRMGKGVGQIAGRCRALRIPCLGLAGQAHLPKRKTGAFMRAHALTDMTGLEDAKRRPAYWLERLAARAARAWLSRT